MTNAELKRWLRRSALGILVSGLCAALAIHLYAEDLPDASLGYVVVDGVLYPLSTQDAKTYRREVQRFGGKAALIFDDFGRWFTSLWRGKMLAKTVAWIGTLAALMLYLLSNSLGPDPPGRDRD